MQFCTSKWDTHEIITRWTLALAFAVLHNGRRLRKLSNHDQHNSIQIDKILHDRDFPSVHQEFSLCETNSLPFFKSLSHKWKSFLPRISKSLGVKSPKNLTSLKGHCHGILASFTMPKYVPASMETQK